MHAVPPNPGERRITMAFNAIPSRLESWGYAITFGAEREYAPSQLTRHERLGRGAPMPMALCLADGA
jgi:hypothetical protein